MNKASAIGTLWALLSILVASGTVTGLVLLGVRRCLVAVRRPADALWRASGFLIGACLLGLAAVVVGLHASDALARWGLWFVLVTATAAVLLWAWCLWTDRAPQGELLPGRYTARPHRPAWLVLVWVVVGSRWLLWQTADLMQPGNVPPVAHLVDLGALVLIGGGLVAAWVQGAARRSWDVTGRTRFAAARHWVWPPGSWRLARGRGTRRVGLSIWFRAATAAAFLVAGLALTAVLVAVFGAWWAAALVATCTGLATAHLVGWAGWVPIDSTTAHRR